LGLVNPPPPPLAKGGGQLLPPFGRGGGGGCLIGRDGSPRHRVLRADRGNTERKPGGDVAQRSPAVEHTSPIDLPSNRRFIAAFLRICNDFSEMPLTFWRGRSIFSQDGGTPMPRATRLDLERL